MKAEVAGEVVESVPVELVRVELGEVLSGPVQQNNLHLCILSVWPSSLHIWQLSSHTFYPDVVSPALTLHSHFVAYSSMSLRYHGLEERIWFQSWS
jgi:hypothetical protein